MNYNFLIHSSVDGHLDCFHVLAIVNSAAMNIGVHVSFSVMFFSRYMPGSGIVGSSGSFIPRFLRNLPIALHSGYVNLHSHQPCKRFPFLHTSPAFIVCRLFDDGHPDQCEVIPHCSFDLHICNNE